MKSYWKPSDSTRKELLRVDQDEWRDELYVLRRSPAARDVFAKAQWYMAVGEEDFFSEQTELFEAVRMIASEVAHRHPLAYWRHNPRRLWVPGVGKFMRLAKALVPETRSGEDGKTQIKTILGWWSV